LPPPEPRLAPGEVHLWCAPLDLPAERIEGLRPFLAADERCRADRFRTGQLRDRFIAARGLLRTVLSRYLGTAPADMQFEYQPHGKPVLAPSAAQPGLGFNISHSHGLLLMAVAADLTLGIDVEQVRPMRDLAGLVERFFATEERQQWNGLREADRLLAFFYGWTRKEAWLKATGSGLSFPLDEFCVSLAPAEPARLISVRGSTAEAAAWQVRSYDLGGPGWNLPPSATRRHLSRTVEEPCPGYVAALAVRAERVEVLHWRLES
jgi:4'-phosphopantetheinyl transferase